MGDVAGKGVDAAVVTALTRYTLRAAAVYDEDPVHVLDNLNIVLRQELQGKGIRMCTLIYGRLTRRGNGFEVELASGGHPPPLLLYANGSAYYVDTTGGQAAGITAEPRFVANRFHLAPGDTLLLYTDGLTEASTGSAASATTIEGALLRFAKSHSPATASGIVDAVHRLLDRSRRRCPGRHRCAGDRSLPRALRVELKPGDRPITTCGRVPGHASSRPVTFRRVPDGVHTR